MCLPWLILRLFKDFCFCRFLACNWDGAFVIDLLGWMCCLFSLGSVLLSEGWLSFLIGAPVSIPEAPLLAVCALGLKNIRFRIQRLISIEALKNCDASFCAHAYHLSNFFERGGVRLFGCWPSVSDVNEVFIRSLWMLKRSKSEPALPPPMPSRQLGSSRASEDSSVDSKPPGKIFGNS